MIESARRQEGLPAAPRPVEVHAPSLAGVRRQILLRAWAIRHAARRWTGAEGQLLRTIHTTRLESARRIGRDLRRLYA